MATKAEIREARERVWWYLIESNLLEDYLLVKGLRGSPWYKIWIDNETLFVQLHETHSIYVGVVERELQYSELLPTLSTQAFRAYGEAISQHKIPEMPPYENTMDDRIVFHYNRAHNQDPTLPPWVVKHHGESHYVWHLTSSVGFNTKETPDNPHTKGSLQFRGNLELREVEGQLQAFIT